MDLQIDSFNSKAPSILSEVIAGSTAGFITDLICYSIDSYKTQLQSGNGVNLRRVFHGAVPLGIVGTIPSCAIFFGIYEPLKHSFERHGFISEGVMLASVCAGVPASIVAVPSDIMKKRLILGLANGSVDAARQVILARGGIRGLFVGWQVNLLRDVPFIVIKLSLYEACIRLVENKSEPVGTDVRALCGVASGSFTAILTNPLDVLNTRLKGSSLAVLGSQNSPASLAISILRQEGLRPFVSGLAPRMAILGFGSGIFWGVHALTRSYLGAD